MRRLMAKEAEDAKARGEIIEETSASDWSSADDDNPGENQGILCNQGRPSGPESTSATSGL